MALDTLAAKSLLDFLGSLEAVAVCGAALGLILVPSILIVSETLRPRPR